MRQIFTSIILITLFLPLCPTMSFAQDTRDFPIPDGLVSDFSGVLSSEDKSMIMGALERAKASNAMDGHVVIVLSSDEWYTEEFVKDYADYLQGRGAITSAGWLMYVSTADRKFSIGVQDSAETSITNARKNEIYLRMDAIFETGDITGGIVEGIDSIAKLDPPSGLEQNGGSKANMFILMGILIVVIVLLVKLRKPVSRG